MGTNKLAAENASAVHRMLKVQSEHPWMLIIGGGSIGGGLETFMQDGSTTLVTTDVYASPNTDLLADAHCLPFKDTSFDCVWITAVLEHVLEPHVVVEQIHRVLKPGGLIYAETPFMVQVHEGPHDFTRFTLSGHRWLFRQFEQIDGGVLGGAGSSLLWAVRYFWRALGTGNKLATVLTIPFFWVRYFDYLMHGRPNADAAFSFYFFGRKSERVMTPKEIIAYYAAQ